MDRFNKSDVVNRVVEARPNTMTKAETGIELSLALDWIAKTVAASNKVVIKGIGTFEPRPRAERMRRNPRTGVRLCSRPAPRWVSSPPKCAPKTDLAPDRGRPGPRFPPPLICSAMAR